jgi:hypothetical protein
MKRREFFIGGAAAGWPLVARAQQSPKPVVEYINASSAQGYARELAAFLECKRNRLRRWQEHTDQISVGRQSV